MMMDAVMVVEMVEYLGLNEVALPGSERVVTLAWQNSTVLDTGC